MAVHLQDLGEQVKAAREQRGDSQDAVAKAASTNRSVVAHLEQGRRVPTPDVLTAVCEYLGIPPKFWKDFLDAEYQTQLAFEEALGELVGRPVSLRYHDEPTADVAKAEVLNLSRIDRTEDQAYDAFNSVLVYYDVEPCSSEFFARYLGPDALRSPADFNKQVRKYQAEVIRLFSTFEDAYRTLNQAEDLRAMLAPLQSKDDEAFRSRSNWDGIETIADERLPDLGYISAQKARQESDERRLLAAFLVEVADALDKEKGTGLSRFTEKRKRKMASLLRKFNSSLPHDFLSPLFSKDTDALRREAVRLAPKEESDLTRMADTQETAQRNLARYLAADHLDVYVATSMRSDADFVSVNAFCRALFEHSDVRPLKLRYFNPTQSWIEDRVAKGLVEALMLRRSAMTLYMAQKTDTFGKDSEASVALGQGKPVIVYVPRLFAPDANVDTESLGLLSRVDLQTQISKEGTEEDREADETMDQQALLSRLLTIRLSKASDATLAQATVAHWADFDLYGEASRIPEESERSNYRSWLDKVVKGEAPSAVPTDVRPHLVGILVAVAVNFEKRAHLFREQHPLALQVILSTGVLNGILVVRSIDSCARLVRALVRNELESEIVIDHDNYRLIEKSTRSTMRVISRHTLIANSFTTFYTRRLL